MTPFDTFSEEIRDYVWSEYPREACGVIAGGRFIPVKNCAKNPFFDFRMPDDTMLKYDVEAVVHSHPDGPEGPSAADMQGQIATAVPWGICIPFGSGHISKPYWWGDMLTPPPLIGREFRHGPSGSDGKGDCYALIRDWYRQEHGVMLPDFPRSDSWWEYGDNLYENNFRATGFKEIAASEARDGDVFFMKVLSSQVNHAGILTGNGQLILHHMSGRLSRQEPLGRWGKFIQKWVRRE